MVLMLKLTDTPRETLVLTLFFSLFKNIFIFTIAYFSQFKNESAIVFGGFLQVYEYYFND